METELLSYYELPIRRRLYRLFLGNLLEEINSVIFQEWENSLTHDFRPARTGLAMNETDLLASDLNPASCFAQAASAAVPPTARLIPNFSSYAIEPDGTCWRVVPPKRGRFADTVRRVTPVIHPKGHQWCVQLTSDERKRYRIPVRKLLQLVFG
jgi:hypothetical protein